MAYQITDACVKCGSCAEQCPVEAISEGEDKYVINPDVCVSCGSCAGDGHKGPAVGDLIGLTGNAAHQALAHSHVLPALIRRFHEAKSTIFLVFKGTSRNILL